MVELRGYKHTSEEMDKGGDTAGEPPRADLEVFYQRLKDRSARIGVIGLGYVGLPLGQAICAAGFHVLGFDVDEAKIDQLKRGRSYIALIPDESLSRLVGCGQLQATSDFARLTEVDAILICVPTPLSRHREPDLKFIIHTTESIAPHLRPGHLIVLESTTYPGTVREVIRPILERTGLKSGFDFFLAYSSERADPGNTDFITSSIPKVVGGDGPHALKLACALYDQFVTATVPVSSLETAEAVKLTENIFRSVNIALVNELKIIYSAMGIDIWEVIEAAKTKPFGFMPFYPGPGLGGHCIPIDPFYLTGKAREFKLTTRFIELAGEINTNMPKYVVDRLAEALDQRFAKGLNGAKVLVLGVAYKKNVEDMRESPALAIMELLEARGVEVSYYDPFIPEIPPTRDHAALADRRSVVWSPEVLSSFDAAMIVTDHDDVDYAKLVLHSRLVVDTRNATRAVSMHRDKIVKA